MANPFPTYGDPLWLPDGQHLLMNHRVLLRIEESPAGSGIYYYVEGDSGGGVYLLDLAAIGDRQVYPVQLGVPDISSDGQYVYYEHQGQIWKLTVQGDSLDPGSAVQVTNSVDGAFGPSVSTSGTRLLYYKPSGASAPGIVITSASGGSVRPVGGFGWSQPDWAPTDSAFTFVSYGTVVLGIGIVDTFGIGAIGIRADGNSPKWSPDGTRIAYLSRGNDSKSRDKLWVMNRDGSNTRQLTSDGVLESFNWSPDGSQIAYTHFVDSDTSYVNGTLWLVNPNTLERRQVTFNQRP